MTTNSDTKTDYHLAWFEDYAPYVGPVCGERVLKKAEKPQGFHVARMAAGDPEGVEVYKSLLSARFLLSRLARAIPRSVRLIRDYLSPSAQQGGIPGDAPAMTPGGGRRQAYRIGLRNWEG